MRNNFEPTGYQLQSVKTGKIFSDSGWMLDAGDPDDHGLIRAIYEKKQIDFGSAEEGIYRFSDWLPIHRKLVGSCAPVTFKSDALCNQLGIPNLYLTFSGYWPEKDATMSTCSFKETEAYSVCGRLKQDEEKVLVVASAGNTARAFAKVCSDNQIPLLLCVPEDYVPSALWFDKPLNDCVKLIVSATGSDYFDAIHLSNLACKHPRFIPEGGAKNVARRDGMATTVLSFAEATGKIPEYYFQAVGSGTGAIAAWEANKRLLEDGRFGHNKMKLIVSQNKPFTPIENAWNAGSRAMLPLDDEMARHQVEQIIAKVLSNRKPPYPLPGGLYDALTDSKGEVVSVTNKQAVEAAHLFDKLEGIDLHPAAAVALASLIIECSRDGFNKEALVMLNLTGGGEKRFAAEKNLHFLKPSLVFDINPDPDDVYHKMETLF